MIRFVYDLDIVIEAMENQDYKDALKMIKDIQEDFCTCEFVMVMRDQNDNPYCSNCVSCDFSCCLVMAKSQSRNGHGIQTQFGYVLH